MASGDQQQVNIDQQQQPNANPPQNPYPLLTIWLDFTKPVLKDFLKPVLISGFFAAVIAIVPSCLNHQNRDTELRIADKKADAEIQIAKAKSQAEIEQAVIDQDKLYVETFLKQATSSKIEERYMFTQYAKSLARDEIYRKGWQELFLGVKEEKEKAQNDLDKKQKDLEKKISELETKSQADRAKAETDITKAQKEINRLKLELRRPSTRDRLLPVSVKLLDITKDPCPSDTEAFVAAHEPFYFDIADAPDLSSVELPSKEKLEFADIWFNLPVWGAKRITIALHCRDKAGNSVRISTFLIDDPSSGIATKKIKVPTKK